VKLTAIHQITLAALGALGFVLPAMAQDAGELVEAKAERVNSGKRPDSPGVGRDFPQQVFFGDTHHHSSYSFDSGMFGNTLGPAESFRFARGEEVTASNGMKAKLIRPLDFLVVSDHAAYLGFTDLIKDADPRLMATKGGKEMVEGYQKGGQEAWLFVVSMMKDFDIGKPRFEEPKLNRSIWESVIDIASQYDAPGEFTAFNGYESSVITSKAAIYDHRKTGHTSSVRNELRISSLLPLAARPPFPLRASFLARI
jgi:hypothetical protein